MGISEGGERWLNEDERRLTKLVRETIKEFGGDPDAPFRPFALWHKDLDTVIVMVRDCSTCHVRINDGLTLMEDNYPEPDEDKYVGFEVHATRRFYESEGLLSDGKVDLNRVLDLLARRFPNNLPEVGICRRLLDGLETTTVELT